MLDQECIISVIVPVYNTGKYIQTCLNSLERQTFSDYEVLLIDDGSTDDSSEICQKMEKQYQRVRYYKKKNGGLSDARNYGVELSRGRYITFIDSDDYVHPKFLERLYRACQTMHTEIAMCFYIPVNDDDSFHMELCKVTEKTKCLSRMEIMDALCSPGISTAFEIATCKLYFKELFQNVSFLVGKLHEDTATTYKLYHQVKNVTVIPDILYCYRQRENSITHKFTKKRFDLIDILEERQKYYETLDCLELSLKHYMYYLNRVCRLRSESYRDMELYDRTSKIYEELIKRELFHRLPVYIKMKYIFAARFSKIIDYILIKKYNY